MSEELFENMNVCFLGGKIVSEVEFNFVYNSKRHTAIVNFLVETNDKNCSRKLLKSVHKVYAYDAFADELYEKLEKGDFVTVIGKVEKTRVKILEYEKN